VTTEAKSPRIKYEIVCVGLVAVAKSKKLSPQFRWIVNGELEKPERTMRWEGLGLVAIPGNVYTVETDVDWATTNARPAFVGKGKLPWVRLWPNRDDRAVWEATTRAIKSEKEHEALRAKAESRNTLRELIEPLAGVYHRLPYFGGQRTAFLMYVQEEIVRLKPKKGKTNGGE
jgi:hypothetical protein